MGKMYLFVYLAGKLVQANYQSTYTLAIGVSKSYKRIIVYTVRLN